MLLPGGPRGGHLKLQGRGDTRGFRMGQEDAREGCVVPLGPDKCIHLVGVRACTASFSGHAWPCGHTPRNLRRPLDSLRPMGSMCTRSSGGVMKCVACGAAMRLMQVQTDTATVCGIERHIFRCSACPQSAQRLMFNRARMSGINVPAAATPTEAPAIKLQAAQAAGLSGWTRAIEKLGSRQTALKERKAVERTSGRSPAVKTPITSTPIALRVTPAPAKPLANSSRPGRTRSRSSAAGRRLSRSEGQRNRFRIGCPRSRHHSTADRSRSE